jgi:hypothetical protein
MRIERDGPDHADISTLVLRRQTFIDVVGDRPVDQYYPRDLQTFVNRMQYWPANVAKRGDMIGKSTLEILESNRQFEVAPAMAKKTMTDGYLANIRTMMRHRIQDLNYRDPFAGAKISYPQAYLASKPREGVSKDVTNRVFSAGVQSGLLDEAIMPLVAKLTSLRLGLLTYLQGQDIRMKDGVWIAQTGGIVESRDPVTGKVSWLRVPIKMEESMTYFVLHNFLGAIGFVDWARRQPGFIFTAAHEHPNPSKYMSKVMQNFWIAAVRWEAKCFVRCAGTRSKRCGPTRSTAAPGDCSPGTISATSMISTAFTLCRRKSARNWPTSAASWNRLGCVQEVGFRRDVEAPPIPRTSAEIGIGGQHANKRGEWCHAAAATPSFPWLDGRGYPSSATAAGVYRLHGKRWKRKIHDLYQHRRRRGIRRPSSRNRRRRPATVGVRVARPARHQ